MILALSYKPPEDPVILFFYTYSYVRLYIKKEPMTLLGGLKMYTLLIFLELKRCL